MQKELYLPNLYYKNNAIFYKLEEPIITKHNKKIYRQYEFQIDDLTPLHNIIQFKNIEIEYTIHPFYTTHGLRISFTILNNNKYNLEYIKYIIEKTILKINYEETIKKNDDVDDFDDGYYDEEDYGYVDGKQYY